MASPRKSPKKASPKPAKGTSSKTTKKGATTKKATSKPASAAKPKAAATKASASKPAPRKEAAPKPAAKAAPAPPPAPAPAPPEPQPQFVREASPAERKAALEEILEKEGVKAVFPTVSAPDVPRPLPAYVRERSALERKAAVEQLVEDSGVANVLAKAPWKRKDSAAAPPAPKPPAPATPADPAAAPPRTSPRLQMTKAPMEQTSTRTPPRIVILDTNALMMQFQFHVDIEREARRILDINFDIVVPTVVLNELQRLAKEGTQKEQGEARMALELAKTFRIEESPNDGDTAIMRLAEQLNAIVVTNDKTLRARLRAKGIPNIYMRSRAFLTLEGHLPGM